MAKFQTSQNAPLTRIHSDFAELAPRRRARHEKPVPRPSQGERFDLVSVVLVVMILLTLFIFIL